jgi:hypothetical protein
MTVPISLTVIPNEISILGNQNINKTIELDLLILKDSKFFNKFNTSNHKNNH